VVLELAPLPREQIGPFILLGLDKTAERDQIEAHWAQRVIWARKSQVSTPLEDVNWARETINDPEKRIRADAASFNVDTTDGTLRRLAERYAAPPPPGAGCQPFDVEKQLADYTPPTEIPNAEEVRHAVIVPEVPRATPLVAVLLTQFLEQPLDPWNILSDKA
jgi:hypothetical protein